MRVTARVRVRVSARGARRVASCMARRDVAVTARGGRSALASRPPAPHTGVWGLGRSGGCCAHGTAHGTTCHAVRSRACAVRADGAVARRRDPRARGGRTVRTRQPKSHPHPPAASRQPRRPSVAPADMRVCPAGSHTRTRRRRRRRREALHYERVTAALARGLRECVCPSVPSGAPLRSPGSVTTVSV